MRTSAATTDTDNGQRTADCGASGLRPGHPPHFRTGRRHLQLRLPTLMTMTAAAAMAFVAQRLSRHCGQRCAHVSLFGIPSRALAMGYARMK